MNRAHRGKSLQWLSGDAALEAALVGLVLKPMQACMNEQLRLAGGVSWTQGVAAASAAIAAGAPLPVALSHGEWPLLAAASGKYERRCMQDLEKLQGNHRHFECWPSSWISIRSRHRLCRMISREAAAVHELLLVKHQKFPFRLFCLATDHSLVQEIEGSCESSRGKYTAQFLQKYAGRLLDGDAQAELAAIVLFGRASTVKLESLNASIRRRLFAVSTQVAKPRLAVLSAEVLLGRVRTRHLERRFPAGHKMARKARSRKYMKAGGDGKKKRRGGGGAWRACACEAHRPALRNIQEIVSRVEAARPA